MILHLSATYWAAGMSVAYDVHNQGWTGKVEFYDDCWIGDDDADTGRVGTEGHLTTRYAVKDGAVVSGLAAVVDTLLADAARLGVQFTGPGEGAPSLTYPGYGEWAEYPPPVGYREILAAQAARIGWRTYGYEPQQPGPAGTGVSP
jgi:hypothetical protein